MLDGIYHINRIIGQVGFILPAAHRFFPLLGAWGEAKSLDLSEFISNVCCCKAPPGWESPEFEPWAGAVGAGAGSAGTSEQADGGNVPNSDEEDVLGRCMYEYIYNIYIVFNLEAGCWLEVF